MVFLVCSMSLVVWSMCLLGCRRALLRWSKYLLDRSMCLLGSSKVGLVCSKSLLLCSMTSLVSSMGMLGRRRSTGAFSTSVTHGSRWRFLAYEEIDQTPVTRSRLVDL
jgi:hypothetical protein